MSSTPDRHALVEPNLICVNGDAAGCKAGSFTAVVIAKKRAGRPGHEQVALRLFKGQVPTRYYVGITEHESSDLQIGDRLEVSLMPNEGAAGLHVHTPYFTEKLRTLLAAV